MGRAAKLAGKLTPYKYPSIKHERVECPPVYVNYRSYKPFLQREFGGQCVYCRKQDLYSDPSAFHIDHYFPAKIAKIDDPTSITDYKNLYYSCAACNRFKRDYWPKNGECSIPNPCDYIMSEHLQYQSSNVEFRSRDGQFAVELLQLNNELSVKTRESQRENVTLLLAGILQFRKVPAKSQVIKRSLEMVAKLTGHEPHEVSRRCGIV